jgi:rubrerythrin
MSRQFARHIEDFICENCGAMIAGNGYTNHCPECLYSKHVDINPGDRQSSCQGLMEPISVEATNKGYILTFRCTKCGTTKRNKAARNDNFETILRVSARIHERKVDE